MFEQTATGYVAPDSLVAHWESRTACLGGCGSVLDPVRVDLDGRHHYDCPLCDVSLNGQSPYALLVARK